MILSSTTAMANFPPSSHSFMFQTREDHHDHLPSTSLNVLPSLPPQHFHGIENKCDPEVHGDDELSDDGYQTGEKKKRLSLEQVKALEKSFELGNKIEPERKIQLAKTLGLQPRQVAIWFQNRRARWKTKQLEKDYVVLKKQFEALKTDNDTLQAQNKKLHAKLQALRGGKCFETGTLSLKKETEGSWSNRSAENSSDINLDLSRTPVINSPISSHHQNVRNLLPNSIKPTSITQNLQCSSRSDVQEENFNMFRSVDEQHKFWTWPEQNHFH